MHPQKESRKSTRHSSNALIHNQISYIIIAQRFKSSIHNATTRTYPGAVLKCDHDLVLCDIRSQKMKISNRVNYKLEKLNNISTSKRHIGELEDKLANINLSEISMDNAYIHITKLITRTHFLGKYKKQRE